MNQVLEGEIVEKTPTLTLPLKGEGRALPAVYVAGDHVPGPDAERQASTRGELVVRQAISQSEALRLVRNEMDMMFRAWARLDLDQMDPTLALGAVRQFVANGIDHLAGLAQIIATQTTGVAMNIDDLEDERLMVEVEGWVRADVAQGAPSENTVRTYLADFRQWFAFLRENDVQPTRATSDQVEAFKRTLLDTCARSTVGRKLSSVRVLYDLARKRGLVGHNPTQDVHAPKDKTSAVTKRKCLSEAEAVDLLRSPSLKTVEGIRDRAMMAVMLLGGLRVSEVAALDLDCLDKSEKRIEVRHGKGDKARDVYVSQKLMGAIDLWLTARDKTRIADGCETALFVTLARNDQGTRMSERSVRNAVDKYLERVGAKRKGISCHALRHTFATHVSVKGGRLEVLTLTLGHSSAATTKVYQDKAMLLQNNLSELLGDWLD